MPAKWFKCPDQQTISINNCLKIKGCRIGERCSTIPYLKMASFDREYKGISPSSAGNGARLIYLKAITDYAIDPMDRAWAALGTAVHEKLSTLHLVENILEEEHLSDKQMEGTADILEIDENNLEHFILTDYKTFGSYKVAKCLGIIKTEEPILDPDGQPVLLKTGKNKGKPKKRPIIKIDPEKIDLGNEILQLNRYRIFFVANGFPISKMRLQVLVRDGGLYIAKSRGITQNLYIIPIPRLDDAKVLYYYDTLQKAVNNAFNTGWAPRCSNEESWDGRRCNGYCEVSEACFQMDKQFSKRTGEIQ